MRILYIADARSPIALNWIAYFRNTSDEIHLVSTYPARRPPGLASFHLLPVAFASAAGMAQREKNSWIRRKILSGPGVGLRTAVRQLLGPVTLNPAAKKLAEILNTVQPELVHAMRIPYEGMLAAMAVQQIEQNPPLLISVWGNDFTLHARSNPWMSRLTRMVLAQVEALHADCKRDIQLAYKWGLARKKPVIVLPGGGGIQTDVFYPPHNPDTRERQKRVVNPRGIRAYVRSDTFFRSIPIILRRVPEVFFLCPAMADEVKAHKWVEELQIAAYVELMPRLSRTQMADLFRSAAVVVSPSLHDGTPNTLLEAMACGSFPVVGDIESLREWIQPGENGLLFDPTNPGEMAQAVLQALDDRNLRYKASTQNQVMINERAEYSAVMARARNFYLELIK